MAEPTKSTSKEQKKSSAHKSGGGGGDDTMDVELVILVLIIVFLLFGVSGSFLTSFSIIENNIYIYRFVLALKIISGTVAALSLAGIGYVLSQSLKLRALPSSIPVEIETRPQQPSRFALEWANIRSRLDTATDADAALIIIDADALADQVLKELKLPGETMGERLIALGEQKFKAIDDLWDAHKIRNQIAHEGAKNITYSDAAYALAKYEKALKELDVI